MRKRFLITDVDNTLFDWVEFWGVAFSAMMQRLGQVADLDLNLAYPEIRKIHQQHGTSEYGYLVEELPQSVSPRARTIFPTLRRG
jgi:phosphoglycolate phosphatase